MMLMIEIIYESVVLKGYFYEGSPLHVVCSAPVARVCMLFTR